MAPYVIRITICGTAPDRELSRNRSSVQETFRCAFRNLYGTITPLANASNALSGAFQSNTAQVVVGWSVLSVTSALRH